MEIIKIKDCAIVTQGKNLDKKYLNTDKKGLPYIVGASSLKECGLVCEKYTEYGDKSELSQLGDIIISTVGTLGKMAVNNIGECVLSKHVCAVRFVPQILPEYGMICLMASIKTCIPPVDEMQTGFSRRLDVSAIEELPLTLIGINQQQETVNKMLALGREFFSLKDLPPALDTLPDDPVELIELFEQETNKILKEQRKTLRRIVEIIKDGKQNNDAEPSQLSFFNEGFLCG